MCPDLSEQCNVNFELSMLAYGQGRILWMLMLMAPGEDFLDVIAKVLPPTDIIDYKLLL